MNQESEGWIIRNLKLYGNALVPNELVDEYGKVQVCRMIFVCSGIRVWIRRVEPFQDRDRMTGKIIDSYPDRRPLYIAEIY